MNNEGKTRSLAQRFVICVWVAQIFVFANAECIPGPFATNPTALKAQDAVDKSRDAGSISVDSYPPQINRISVGLAFEHVNLREGNVFEYGFDATRRLFVLVRGNKGDAPIGKRLPDDVVKNESSMPKIWQLERFVRATDEDVLEMGCLLNALVATPPGGIPFASIHSSQKGNIVMPGRMFNFTSYSYPEAITQPILNKIYEKTADR
jgi:hypothetical protein